MAKTRVEAVDDALFEAGYPEAPFSMYHHVLFEFARTFAGEADRQDAEIKLLREVVQAKLHQRRCWGCGHVGWHADAITPYCLCEKCGSQDTRLLQGGPFTAEEENDG